MVVNCQMSIHTPQLITSISQSHKSKDLSFQRPKLSILNNSSSYASILDSCKSPYLGSQIHAQVFKTGFCRDEFVGTKLLQMYARCGSFENADLLFDKMPVRNLYAYTTILSVYIDLGLFEEAFSLFTELRLEDFELEFFLFPVVFKICSGVSEVGLGRQFHGTVVKYGFFKNIYVCNALIDMYGKCKSLVDAKRVFERMSEKDCVSWNSIVSACASNGMAFEALEFLEKMASSDKNGYISKPNIVSWSSVLGGFSQNGYDEKAIEILFRMRQAGFEPNARTLASVIPSCARLKRLSLGKEIHGYITRHGFVSNPFLVNGLVDFYRRCSDMRSALAVFSKLSDKNTVSCNTMIVGYFENGEISKAKEFFFDQMRFMGIEKDVTSWNSVISGLVDNCSFDEAFRFFRESLCHGIEPNSFTLGSVLESCAETASLRLGKEIHSLAVKTGLKSDPFVAGALVEMYCRCRDLFAARRAFDGANKRDVPMWNVLISGHSRSDQIEEIQKLLVEMKENGFDPNEYTWNGVISGHVENNRLDLAIEVFIEMCGSNLRPDIYTVGIILPACARSATIERGKQVHAYSMKNGFDSDFYIGAALMDMYAKCGTLNHSIRVYNRISSPNLVSHNSMLTAYAMHGKGNEGINFFRNFLDAGFEPDSVTFLSALSSCVHIGSVETGHEIFGLMSQFGVKPTLKHYTCMVDLLSRASRLKEAYGFITKMPLEPDSVLWGSLLGGCVIHGDVGFGEIAAKRLIELEPDKTGNYVLLANLYAYGGKWNELARMRRLMKDRGMQKSPGCSWIEDRDKIHVFVASDKSHERSKEIYSTLDNLTTHMKDFITCL